MMRWYVWVMLLLVIPSAIATAVPANTGDVFVAQENTSIPRLHEALYPGASGWETMRSENAHIPGLFVEAGDEVLLPSHPDVFATAPMVEGQHVWDAWQRYGVVRGFTFSTFVTHNIKEHDNMLPDTLRPFEVEASWSDVSLSYAFNQTETDNRHRSNEELLTAIASADDGRLLFVGNPYSETVMQNLQDRVASSLQDDPSFDARYVVVDQALLDRSSLSVSVIGEKLFKGLLMEDDGAGKEKVLFMFIKDRTVAITYPNSSNKTEERDAFFDGLLTSAKESCAGGYGPDVIFRVVLELDASISTRVHGP